MADTDENSVTPTETHRGAFGEFGGESAGLIDRSFRERIVLVGVTMPPETNEETEASLDELSLLVDTAGADEVGRIHQRRQAPDPATFVGKGKADEIKDMSHAVDSDTVVFDDELSPAQQVNLEKILGRTALDRTAVILDIFAQNASSTEGKAQVELAQLKYRLPRLRGLGRQLSQQGVESEPGVRARPSSRSIGDGSSGGCTSSRTICDDSRRTGRPSRRRGSEPRTGRWRSSATRMRASRPC